MQNTSNITSSSRLFEVCICFYLLAQVSQTSQHTVGDRQKPMRWGKFISMSKVSMLYIHFLGCSEWSHRSLWELLRLMRTSFSKWSAILMGPSSGPTSQNWSIGPGDLVQFISQSISIFFTTDGAMPIYSRSFRCCSKSFLPWNQYHYDTQCVQKTLKTTHNYCIIENVQRMIRFEVMA